MGFSAQGGVCRFVRRCGDHVYCVQHPYELVQWFMAAMISELFILAVQNAVERRSARRAAIARASSSGAGDALPTVNLVSSEEEEEEVIDLLDSEYIPEDIAGSSAGAGSSSTDVEVIDVDANPVPAQPPRQRKRMRVRRTSEGRGASYRPRPSQSVLLRYQRTYRHRLLVVDSNMDSSKFQTHFAIMGSNGNIYNSTIARVPSCDCPDYQKRHLPRSTTRGPCKHIIFIFIRVFKLDKEDPRWWQSELSQTELEDLFATYNANGGMPSDVMADEAVRKQYHRAMGHESASSKPDDDKAVEGECPICFDEMTVESSAKSPNVIRKCTRCNNYFHGDCFAQWLALQDKPSCPLCRGKIRIERGHGGSASQQYMNLAAYSRSHQTVMTLDELYDDTFQHIGRRRRRRHSRPM